MYNTNSLSLFKNLNNFIDDLAFGDNFKNSGILSANLGTDNNFQFIDWFSRVSEDGRIYYFQLPGFNKDEISVTIDGDQLKINASTEREIPFAKSRKLSCNISKKLSRIKEPMAKLENGILSVEFEFAEELTPKTLTIH